MTIPVLKEILGWCVIMNFGLLLLWFFFIAFAHDWVYRVHSKWFHLPVESFDKIHYAGIAFFKVLVFVFYVVPYLALCLVG